MTEVTTTVQIDDDEALDYLASMNGDYELVIDGVFENQIVFKVVQE